MIVDLLVENIEFDPTPVESSARRLLEILELPQAELSIVLCDDSFIQPLNLEYRGKDRPTDVLSFAMQEGEGCMEDDPVLGDIVISVQTAAVQGAEHGHGTERELQVLLIHGLLHLLGYDHEQEEAQALEMEAQEKRLLALLIA